MRTIPREVLDAFLGSQVNTSVRFHVWYDGMLKTRNLNNGQGLPVVSWDFGWDLSRQVQGQGSMVVRDNTGDLSPWGFDDTLGCGGSEIQASLRVTGTDGIDISTDLGTWQIDSAKPKDTWRIVADGTGELVAGGSTIPLQLSERTQEAVDDELLTPESPATGATVFSEVTRLLRYIMPVSIPSALTSRNSTVPRNTVYKKDRMDAVEDLLRAIQLAGRMDTFGQFEIYDPRDTTPRLTLSPGRRGTVLDFDRSQSRSDITNAVVSTGKTADGQEIQKYAFLNNGPLRYGGPVGRRPRFRENPLAQTESAVQKDAETSVANDAMNQTMVIGVQCLFDPRLQVGDWVTVVNPTLVGGINLNGRVLTEKIRGSAAGVGPMDLEVECSANDVQELSNVIRRLKR